MKITLLFPVAALALALPAFSQSTKPAPTDGSIAASNPPAPNAPIPSPFLQRGDISLEVFGASNSGPDRAPLAISGATAGAQAGVGLGHQLVFNASYAYDAFGDIGSTRINAKEFNAGIERFFAPRRRLNPYFRIDVGGIREVQIVAAHPGSTETQVAVSPGFGALLPINKIVSLDFAVRAVVPAASNALPWQIQGLVGVAFRIPHHEK